MHLARPSMAHVSLLSAECITDPGLGVPPHCRQQACDGACSFLQRAAPIEHIRPLMWLYRQQARDGAHSFL